MIKTPTLAFMDMNEAAAALGIHPNNLAPLAKAGVVPAAKIGKEWRFLDVDLAEYMRTQYAANNNRAAACRPSNAAKSGGRTSHPADKELEEALGLPIRRKTVYPQRT